MRAPPLLVMFATGWRVPVDRPHPDPVWGTRTTRAAPSQGCSRRLDGEHAQLIASKLPCPEGRGGTGVAQLFPERTPLVLVQVSWHQGEESRGGQHDELALG